MITNRLPSDRISKVTSNLDYRPWQVIVTTSCRCIAATSTLQESTTRTGIRPQPAIDSVPAAVVLLILLICPVSDAIGLYGYRVPRTPPTSSGYCAATAGRATDTTAWLHRVTG